MNGAMAEPEVKTIKRPSSSRTIISGSSQYFFLVLKKPHKSFTKLILFLLGCI
jgi:hypothetical protein